MIKKLIEKLADESLSLTSALIQTKIIAAKIENDDLKNWLQFELKGYPQEMQDKLPEYRIFPVQIRGDVIDQWGIKSTNVILMTDKLGEQMGVDMNLHFEKHDIGTIEHTVTNANSQFVENPFHPKFVEMLNDSLQQDNPGHRLISAGRQIAISNLRNILIQTRQRLLDTLLELDSEFPELDINFEASNENKQKAQSIVNLNVYGGSANTNLGIGETVIQRDISFTSNDVKELMTKFREFGVPEEDIQEAKQIIESTPRESISKKLLNWAGKLSTKVVEKGIEIKLPALIETISNFV